MVTRGMHQHRRSVRVGALLGAVALVTGVLTSAVMVASADPAFAQPSDVSTSYYVQSGDTPQTAYSWGCSQAQQDSADGESSVEILDFGAQAPSNNGTYLTGRDMFMPYGAEEFFAANFAEGYQVCDTSGEMTMLGIGTNNDGSITDGALGAGWGNVVQAVVSNASSSGYSNVVVDGAIDAEPGYGPASHVEGWENGDSSGGGYVSTTSAEIFDYGSADGCPYSPTVGDGSCNNGWLQSDEYDIAWGYSLNLALPEIYGHPLGQQWEAISQWGASNASAGEIFFTGPLSEYGAPYSPDEAWVQLANDTGESPPDLTVI
jgi:hypothetical protein